MEARGRLSPGSLFPVGTRGMSTVWWVWCCPNPPQKNTEDFVGVTKLWTGGNALLAVVPALTLVSNASGSSAGVNSGCEKGLNTGQRCLFTHNPQLRLLEMYQKDPEGPSGQF